MTDNPLPSDFDWVTARAQCSAAEMFESLRQLAQANVTTINACRGGADGQRPRFHLRDSEPSLANGFAVWDTFAGRRRAVLFQLRGDVIHIEATRPGHEFDATLTLNDAGQCRFKTAAEELDKWQVLRRALEWLFFEDRD